jgi:hypothetical protein
LTGVKVSLAGSAIASLLVTGLAAADECRAQVARADRAAMTAIPGWWNPLGIASARAVSAVAEPAFAAPVLAAVAIRAARRQGWRAGLAPAVAVPAGMLARRALADLIARPRPPADLWLASPEGYSLPSRHTTLTRRAA